MKSENIKISQNALLLKVNWQLHQIVINIKYIQKQFGKLNIKTDIPNISYFTLLNNKL